MGNGEKEKGVSVANMAAVFVVVIIVICIIGRQFVVSLHLWCLNPAVVSHYPLSTVAVLYCTVLLLCCTVLYCTVTVLYCTVLYCTVLYCAILYYITFIGIHTVEYSPVYNID